MPKRLKMVQSALWEKASAFHWGMTIMACLGLPALLCGVGGVPAGVDDGRFRGSGCGRAR